LPDCQSINRRKIFYGKFITFSSLFFKKGISSDEEIGYNRKEEPAARLPVCAQSGAQ
jgi:hypothetical protein